MVVQVLDLSSYFFDCSRLLEHRYDIFLNDLCFGTTFVKLNAVKSI